MKRLLRYHYSLGDSTTGPLGFCAAVWAQSRAEADRFLGQAIQHYATLDEYTIDHGNADGSTAGLDYLQVYFGEEYRFRPGDVDAIEDERGNGLEIDAQGEAIDGDETD